MEEILANGIIDASKDSQARSSRGGLGDLPESLETKILYKLDNRSKLQAARVCRTFRRLLVTDADPGSYGPLIIEFGETGSAPNGHVWNYADCSITLDPLDTPKTYWMLSALLGGSRSRRFSRIELRLYSRSQAVEKVERAPQDSNMHFAALSCAISLLHFWYFRGELHLDPLYAICPCDVERFCDIVRCFWVPTTFGLLDFTSEQMQEEMDLEGAIRGLAELCCSHHLRSIGTLHIPVMADMFLTEYLSSLVPIGQLYVGPRWEGWGTAPKDRWFEKRMSLTQIGGLRNFQSLHWLPRLRPPEAEAEAEALRGMAQLTCLEMDSLCKRAWDSIMGGEGLTALRGLRRLSLNVWECGPGGDAEGAGQGAQADPESPLSSLAPVSLPDSLEEAALWFRVTSARTSLHLDSVFASHTHCSTGPGSESGRSSGPGLATLTVGVVGEGPPRGREGENHFVLSLGPAISSLAASLTRLEVGAHGAIERRASLGFPAELATLTALKEFRGRGSCGEDDIPRYPWHWTFKGLRKIGRDTVYRHPSEES